MQTLKLYFKPLEYVSISSFFIGVYKLILPIKYHFGHYESICQACDFCKIRM